VRLSASGEAHQQNGHVSFHEGFHKELTKIKELQMGCLVQKI
jgi:hypothetical protein